MGEIYQVTVPAEELYTKGSTIASVTHEKNCPMKHAQNALKDAVNKINKSSSKEPLIRIVPNTGTTKTIRTQIGELREQTDFECELCSKDKISTNIK